MGFQSPHESFGENRSGDPSALVVLHHSRVAGGDEGTCREEEKKIGRLGGEVVRCYLQGCEEKVC